MKPLRYVILAGPTATGKSEAAVRVAEACGTEVIGADAFQAYAGLDLLSAKPTVRQRERVPHHLIGVVPLTATYNAHQYAQQARAIVQSLNAAGRVPLVVGGTGFYLRALTHTLPELPAPDSDLRAELQAEPLERLLEELARLDPAAFLRIDRQNPRRVVRALEVCRLTGRPFSSFAAQAESFPPRCLLTCPRTHLRVRIDARVKHMFAQGVVAEVAGAGEVGHAAAQMIGYQPIRDLLAGRVTLHSCMDAIRLRTWQYARRQMTWFNSEPFRPVPAEDVPGIVSRELRLQAEALASDLTA
ncbi:MAG TPA: tRNA (adenosine(37)-N6)-dimethylallyltransferase MiaA [Chthoniobacterales bacterium]